MNKQEAIEKIKYMDTLNINDMITNQKVDMVIKNQVLDIISQIDEPQKPVVPKFVAEWLEWCKTNYVTLLGAISPIDELGSAICNDKRVKSLAASRWAQRNQDTFARAWLDGYSVETEKLYTVEIPNPGITDNSDSVTVLMKTDLGVVLTDVVNYIGREQESAYQLTEAEIKQDFDFLWQFKKEVEEDETE